TGDSPPVTSTLSLHDALPILLRLCRAGQNQRGCRDTNKQRAARARQTPHIFPPTLSRRRPPPDIRRQVQSQPNQTSSHKAIVRRSEEHTSELQSQSNLVCRLL